MNPFALTDIVALALQEDLGPGDLTSRLTIPQGTKGRASLVAREALILSGAAVAREAFRQVDESLKFELVAADGDHLEPGDVIARLDGLAASILTGERVALNFLMRLSGVATTTARYVAAAANPEVAVVDTRKTTPGLRILEKAAVRHGGGRNHRFALYDGLLIKDNHIAACGSIAKAVSMARNGLPHGFKVEVEVDTLAQLKEALKAGAELVLLDNMPPDMLREAVKITTDFHAPAPRVTLLEASGGVNLETISAISQTGVDLISVGALTHSATAVDLGLDWV